jgi:8-oxo-dGTP pyrophosphatase MutT (NUDIX family)
MSSHHLLPVFVGSIDEPVGSILSRTADLLKETAGIKLHEDRLVLPGDTTSLERAFASAHEALESFDLVAPIRNETMPILTDFDGVAIATVDRSLLRTFGFRGVKVHINGLVRTSAGPKVWLARRAADRRASPLHLDTMVAGGQPFGKTIMETVLMEAGEEAGLNFADLVGIDEVKRFDISYTSSEGHHLERLIIHDLWLPETFIPVLHDGELIESLLVSVPEMAELLDGADRFKYNSAIVCRDLLGRLS